MVSLLSSYVLSVSNFIVLVTVATRNHSQSRSDATAGSHSGPGKSDRGAQEQNPQHGQCRTQGERTVPVMDIALLVTAALSSLPDTTSNLKSY